MLLVRVFDSLFVLTGLNPIGMFHQILKKGNVSLHHIPLYKSAVKQSQ